MRDAYDALLNEYRSRYRKMTPKQQTRELKHQDFIAKTVSKQNLFCSVYGLSDYVTPMNHKGERSVVTGYDAIALEFAKLRWNVVCYALCREKNGDPYLKGMELYITEPVRQSQINKSLSQIHYDWMTENVNKKHLLTLAWIATTAEPPPEKIAMRIFLSLGAFDAFDYITEGGNKTFNLKPKEIV